MYIEYLGKALAVVDRILVQRADIKVVRRKRLCVELRKGHGTNRSIIPTGTPSVVKGGYWDLIWTI